MVIDPAVDEEQIGKRAISTMGDIDGQRPRQLSVIHQTSTSSSFPSRYESSVCVWNFIECVLQGLQKLDRFRFAFR